MLKRLRHEFIAITVALVGIVLVAALGSTLLTTWQTQVNMTGDILSRALEHMDEKDEQAPEQGPRSGLMLYRQGGDAMLTIVLNVSADGGIYQISNQPDYLSTDVLQAVVDEAVQSSADSGWSAKYSVSWLRSARDYGYRIAIADTTARDAALRAQAVNDLVIIAVSMGALFLVVRHLAGWALRPVEEAWERQRRFVSDASHELKTPLAVILANTQILEADPKVEGEASRWVKSTAEEAEHMKSLVEDLLTLARADEEAAAGLGSSSAAKADVDLSSLVDGCALEFDAVAFERGCGLSCEVEPNIHVTGDPSQLGRAVRTLLDNATKYAEKGTEVRVRLAAESKRDRRARLTVNNRGEVIAPADLEHLFDRFYRTDAARERQQTGGFGLGLAIARSIVEAHGGKIWAESTKEDGTTFTVVL